MAYFDMRGQTVTNQWNIVNQAVGDAVDRESLVTALNEVIRSVKKEYADENISDAEFKDVKENLELAKAEVTTPTPDKPKLTGYLDKAKTGLTNLANLAAVYAALEKLIEKIPDLPF